MRISGKPFSGFAVDDIAAARTFYADVLGLTVQDEGTDMLRLQLDDDTAVLVYPKPDHAPATFTILNFPVPDISAAVEELSERGVRFERYDGMDQDEQGIMRADGPLIAWFTDPAGNILSVIES